MGFQYYWWDAIDYMEVESETEEHRDIFGWLCVVCKEWALNGDVIETVHVESNETIVNDSDGTPWFKCYKCGKTFHVRCFHDSLEWEYVYSLYKNRKFQCC